jgi:hypothetical protein
MASESLADQIREGFVRTAQEERASRALTEAGELEPVLASLRFADLPEAVRRAGSRETANEVLAAVVRSYQAGPRDVWAPVLLEMLAPALMETGGRLHIRAHAITQGDLYQQLVTELLDVAAVTPTAGERWLKLRLIRHARKRLVRWLERESAAAHSGADAMENVAVGIDGKMILDHIETPDGPVPARGVGAMSPRRRQAAGRREGQRAA